MSNHTLLLVAHGCCDATTSMSIIRIGERKIIQLSTPSWMTKI
jgi:hypothetical protein